MPIMVTLVGCQRDHEMHAQAELYGAAPSLKHVGGTLLPSFSKWLSVLIGALFRIAYLHNEIAISGM